MLNWLKSLLGVAGAAVDTAVPVATGDRTVLTVLTGLAAKFVPAVLPLIPAQYSAPIAALLPLVNQAVAFLAPLFAMAHFARGMAPAKPASK